MPFIFHNILWQPVPKVGFLLYKEQFSSAYFKKINPIKAEYILLRAIMFISRSRMLSTFPILESQGSLLFKVKIHFSF